MKRERTKAVKRKIRIILLSILSVVVIIITLAYLSIHIYIQKMNLVSAANPDNSVTAGALSENPTVTEIPEFEEVDPEVSDSPEDEILSLEEKIQTNMEEDSSPLLYDKNVFNVLLIGSDTRKVGGSGRSDVMILISINKKTKEIIVTSFLRDIYLQIPGRKNNRLNAAFAFGGADLLMDTVEKNFKIKIDQYASLDFYSFIDIVDAVGGVTIAVTKEEIPVINDYLEGINGLLGDEEGSDYLSDAGTFLLNGKQALAYSRNRYVGNGDFARTERQRKVLEQIFLKVKGLNIIKLKALLDIILPQITTNLTEGEMFSLILSLPAYMKYDTVQWSVPVKGSYKSMRINGMAVLGVDFSENIKELNNKIYGNALE